MAAPHEVELRRYLRSQRALTAQLLAGESLDQVATGFLWTISKLLRWDAGALWEAQQGAEELRFVAGWSGSVDAEPLWQLSRELSFPRGAGLPGRAWERGEIVWASDIGDDPEPTRQSTSAELGLTAALAIPIPVGPPEGVLAVAEFHARSSTSPSEELMELLSAFADQLATFIGRRQVAVEAARVRNHFAEVVKGTQDAVLGKDLDGVITSWNPAAERLYGYTAAEAVGRHVAFLMPPERKHEEGEILDRVRRGERLGTYETQRVRKDGVCIDVSLTISRIEDPVLGVVGASVIARDITAEVRRRKAQDFLVAASRDFDASLDPSETARNIVNTVVPQLAEVCVIDFVRADGWIGDSVVAAAAPGAAERLEAIRRESPLDPAGEHPVAQVLRHGRPMIWRDLTAPDVVGQVAQNEAHRRLMEDTGYNSAAVVALAARGRTFGALSFLHASKDLRYDSSDLEFLSELADRAAIALDNARLYRERDLVAKNLQRGLRPPRPPEVPGLEISVVFEAAGEGIEIGGDFYDVLPTDDGCWILIGDVAGKGSAAAGVSVAVRHSVRGLTREIDEPEEVLARVNELLLEGTSLNDFATAMLIRMRAEREGWRLALASAGHPPAVHVTANGPVQMGGGAVLGAWADAPLERSEATVAPGDTLVLCTDGWFEAGPSESHRPPEALADVANALSGLDLEELTERLRLDVVSRSGGSLRDDVVLLAVRPAATGPQDSEARGDERLLQPS